MHPKLYAGFFEYKDKNTGGQQTSICYGLVHSRKEAEDIMSESRNPISKQQREVLRVQVEEVPMKLLLEAVAGYLQDHGGRRLVLSADGETLTME